MALRAFGEVENALAAEIAALRRELILAQTFSDSQQGAHLCAETQFKVWHYRSLRFVERRQLALSATAPRSSGQSEQRVQRVKLHPRVSAAASSPASVAD